MRRMPALVNVAFTGEGGGTRPTDTARDAFVLQTPELASMRENNTKCKRAFAASIKRGVFFADPGVAFDENAILVGGSSSP